ncbi:hypothetical protein BMS3Bbin16_00209 [archaeon BMS3Bbin16]|nr:hypothetical protein BMS3Bbin16_00209 [archaeon BMS3Bbin16]
MKESTAKKLGLGYDKELYKKPIYFWLHRVHVTAAFFAFIGPLVFLLPEIAAAIVMVTATILLLIFTLIQRLKMSIGINAENDFLFNRKFYRATLIFSTLTYGMVFTLLILKNDVIQGLINNPEIGELFVGWLKYPLLFTFLNSIFMLNSKALK